MTHAYIVGSASTAFQRWPERGFSDLAREVVEGALGDARLEGPALGEELGGVWFGNCAMGHFGQANIRGQACLAPLQRDGLLPWGLPVANVEAGCATGSLALQGAVKDVLSGESRFALALGVEKTFIPDDPARMLDLFLGGADRLRGDAWLDELRELARAADLPFEPHPARVVFLDTHALQAKAHMRRFGTTPEHLAHTAAKDHRHGGLNPKAQYGSELTPAEVLADKPVVEPFTRAMCAPISDGAAAVLVCSEEALAGLDPAARERAVRVRASVVAGGRPRGLDEPGVTAVAARRAFARAGLTPADVDVAEVHDATSFCELQNVEQLGLCPEGQGGPWVTSGAASLGGDLPVNTSGGLVSRGHPLAATGLGQIDELVLQLRGEAGQRQAGAPRIALQHNAGGLTGIDEAACAVHLLEKE